MSPDASVLCHRACNIQLAFTEHLLRDGDSPLLQAGTQACGRPLLPACPCLGPCCLLPILFVILLSSWIPSMGLQACCDCEPMPFTTQRGHLGLECFHVCLLSVDKYPGACGEVMRGISLRASRQKSSPTDRVSQPRHSGTAGPLLHILSGHVPSEPGTLDRVPQRQGLHLLSVKLLCSFMFLWC